jgi:hypothetical protein
MGMEVEKCEHVSGGSFVLAQWQEHGGRSQRFEQASLVPS